MSLAVCPRSSCYALTMYFHCIVVGVRGITKEMQLHILLDSVDRHA